MLAQWFSSGTVRRGVVAAGVFAAVLLPALGAALAQSSNDFEHEPINYSASTSENTISRLQQRIDKGEVSLRFDSRQGYLPSVLALLKVPVSSQMLVFSKTSFQRDLISPTSPRAIYFNEDAYVGWVQGGEMLEFTAVDPQLGAVFYTLSQAAAAKPKFVRQKYECLSCHQSGMTSGVPGHMVRSVYPGRDGLPFFSAGSVVSNDQSPMKERWGGWYVTGTHGGQRHMGNLILRNAGEAEGADLSQGANVTDLRRHADLSRYPTRHSDIVALMVLEHQTHLQNLITKANYETRRALHFEAALKRDLKEPGDKHFDSTLSRIRSVGEPLVRAMLFVKEAPLTAPVQGTSGFQQEFARGGVRDPQGRSLRELDLKQRLFRYPLSYLIYSKSFDGLPPLAKEYVYRRLRQVLTGQEKGEEFAHLTDADRKAILEILTATKPDFAAAK